MIKLVRSAIQYWKEMMRVEREEYLRRKREREREREKKKKKKS